MIDIVFVYTFELLAFYMFLTGSYTVAMLFTPLLVKEGESMGHHYRNADHIWMEQGVEAGWEKKRILLKKSSPVFFGGFIGFWGFYVFIWGGVSFFFF